LEVLEYDERMPANTPRINLLGEQDLQHSPWGRLLTWATTYGRYIMITTEVIVLLAFISRFSLDRKLTDLKEEISQKQEIIQANSDFEKEFRDLQERMKTVKTLIADQQQSRNVLEELRRALPPDVYFESFAINERNVTVKIRAMGTAGFSQFVANITSMTTLKDIDISDIKKHPSTGIGFQLTAHVATQGVKK